MPVSRANTPSDKVLHAPHIFFYVKLFLDVEKKEFLYESFALNATYQI